MGRQALADKAPGKNKIWYSGNRLRGLIPICQL
jgi:hypothetical protein